MSRRILFPALLASLFATSAIACSSGEDTNDVIDDGRPDASAPDAVSPNEDEDAAAPDGGAKPDSAVEPPRTCSDDNICHTALPPKSFLRDVWSTGDGVVWAVGWSDSQLIAADGVILRWDGTSWAQQHKVPLRLNAVWGSSPTDIWVGGDSGLFHGTGPSSAQITWTKVRSEPIVSIWGSSANDVWAVGHTRTWQDSFDGKVLHYRGPSADGDGWEIDPLSSRPAAYRKVWGTGASDVWIGGSEFATCGYDFCNGSRAFALRRVPDGDGGFTWSEAGAEFGGVAQGSGVHRGSEFSGGGSIGPSDVWLMGNKAPTTPVPSYDVLFIGSKAAGAGDFTWSDGTFGSCKGSLCPFGLWFNRAVWGKTPNDVYLAGDFGQLRHWNGTGFSLVKTTIDAIPVTAAFHAMWGSSSTDLWIVGDEIALHKVSPTKL